MHVAHAVPVDQAQHVLGLETRLKDHVQAQPRARHAVGRRRRMVHRAVHQHDNRGIGLQSPEGRRLLPRRGLLLRRAGPAAHALGAAGRSGGVDHAAACRFGRGRARRRSGNEIVPRHSACRRHAAVGGNTEGRREFLGRWDHQHRYALRHTRCDLRQEVAVRHQHLGGTVTEDVAGFFRREVPVERHCVGAKLTGRHVDLKGREVVAQHQRHAVVLAHAEHRQTFGGASGIGLDVGPTSETLACSYTRSHVAYSRSTSPISL